MSSDSEANALEGLRGRLAEIRARIEQTDPVHPPDLKRVRQDLERAQDETESLGLPETAGALQRLALMTEVWECLALEGSDTVKEVASFCAKALEALEAATLDDFAVSDLSWITLESTARWNDYIQLLDPWSSGSSDSPPNPVEELPPPPDDSPALDTNSLIRMIMGGVGPPPAKTPTRAPEAATGSGLHRLLPKTDELRAEKPAVPGAATRPLPQSLVASADVDESTAATPAHDALRPAWDAKSGGSRTTLDESEPAENLIPPGLDLDPEFREAFIAESSDLFERIEGLVLQLGREGDQSQLLHELGRCFHTLKGAAGSVGLVEFTARVHALEDRLESTSATAPPDLVDLLHKTLGDFERILQELRRGPTVKPAAVSHDSGPPPWPSRYEPARRPNETQPSEPRGDSSGNDSLLRISACRIDELMDLVSELIARRGVLSAQAETVKALAATARTCRNRLLASIERLRDVGADPRVDLPGLIRGLTEQGEDLAVLIQSAQASAVPLTDDGDAIARISLQLWDTLQAIQIVPVRGLFHRLARVARDAARVEGREVEVVMVGEDTGLDRAVQDKAFEPLLHIVRNAVGHGIEAPDQRVRAGKPSMGRVTLEARREGNRAVLVVRDDGRGLDYSAIEAKGRRLGLLGPDESPGIDRLNALIFHSGFSTRQEANSISGRGVGMDVVSKEVSRLRGTIDLASQQGLGTSMTIRLPTRLALERAMVVRVDGQAFALPVELIELAQPFDPKDREEWGNTAAIRIRDERVPLVDARRALGISVTTPDACPKLILVRADGEPLAVLVDAIDGPRELVVKPLSPLLSNHPVISGTSVSVTGEVILSLNPSDLARWHRDGTGLPASSAPQPPPPTRSAPVLVVDDSISVRRVAARHLSALGFEVDEVSDGVEALQKLRARTYRLVLTDLEMPRMDGFELLAQIDRMGTMNATPVVVTSTRSDAATRRRVLDLGAAAFVPKPLEPSELAAVVGKLGPFHDLVPA